MSLLREMVRTVKQYFTLSRKSRRARDRSFQETAPSSRLPYVERRPVPHVYKYITGRRTQAPKVQMCPECNLPLPLPIPGQLAHNCKKTKP